MKNIIISFLCVFLFSCEKPESIYKYCGYQVVSKSPLSSTIKFRKDTIVTDYIHIITYDFDNIQVGDTIKCK